MNTDLTRSIESPRQIATVEIAEGDVRAIVANFAPLPDADRATQSYRNLAPGYDESCSTIVGIRARAMAQLAIQPGETVADVACGTGATLVQLGLAVGDDGAAIGLELSTDMAELANQRIKDAGLTGRCQMRVGAIESYKDHVSYDALLFCYTHDVLQSPRALQSLFAHARAGARVVVVGARFLPWWWGFPLNLFTGYRARRYLTTFRGLREPWRLLVNHCPDFRLIGSDHLGTSYLGVGIYKPNASLTLGKQHAKDPV